MEDQGLNPSQIFRANWFSKKNPNPLQSEHLSLSFTKTYTSHLWQYSLWHKLECSTWVCKCKELARSTRWSNDMKFCHLVTEIHFHTKPQTPTIRESVSGALPKPYTTHLWQNSGQRQLECSTWLWEYKELARCTRWSYDISFHQLVTKNHFHTKP